MCSKLRNAWSVMGFKVCSANNLGALGVFLKKQTLNRWPKEDFGHSLCDRRFPLMGCREALTTEGLSYRPYPRPASAHEAGLHAGQLSQVPCLGNWVSLVQMFLEEGNKETSALFLHLRRALLSPRVVWRLSWRPKTAHGSFMIRVDKGG